MMAALRRPRSLRAYLLNLVILAVLPLIGFAIVLIVTLLHQQRVAGERALVKTTRALAIATDSRIGAEIERLEVLATSPALSAGDLGAFYEEATRAATVGNLESIALIDRSGQLLLSLRHPFGSGGLPNVSDRQYVRDVVATGKAVVSDVVSERTIGRPIIFVGVPVNIQGKLRYVLSSTPPNPDAAGNLGPGVDPASLDRYDRGPHRHLHRSNG